MVRFSEINYKNLGKCICFSNDVCEVLVSVDVGPRIVSYRLLGKENMLAENEVDFKTPTNEVFSVFGDLGMHKHFGGHRLWASPEDYPKTHFPDNHPCKYVIDGEKLLVVQMEQPFAEIQTSMEMYFDDSGDFVINHFIKNVGKEEKELALWPITVMDAGGVSAVPMCQDGPRFLHNRNFSFWTYSDLTDERFKLGKKYVVLKQSAETKAFKFGMNCTEGYAAYFNHECAFVKFFEFDTNGKYPDGGCNYESYTGGRIFEMESLSPLFALKEGEVARHREKWRLKECNFSGIDDESIDETLNEIL